MEDIRLSLAISSGPLLQPIARGRVVPDGIDLVCTELRPAEIFRRQLGFKEFDVSEMSMSHLLISRAQLDETWIALPVFTSRRFAYANALVPEYSDITRPTQLAGKRVAIAVSEYQHTGALWTRGILHHEFGLDPTSVTWFIERPTETGRGSTTSFHPPSDIDLRYLPPNRDIGEMLLNGELDAALHYPASRDDSPDASTPAFGEVGSGTRHLFNEPEESTRYFHKTGIFPIHHCVVVRKDIVDRCPWVMLNLFSAFVEAKRIALQKMASEWAQSNTVPATDPPCIDELGPLGRPTGDLLETDPYPYGVAANLHTLETMAQFAYEQGLVPNIPLPDDVFVMSDREA